MKSINLLLAVEERATLNWYKENLHAYLCNRCEERFFIEMVLHPNSVSCPYCGEGDVSINSEDYLKSKR